MTFALITGASGGIGLSLARELAKHKHNLLLVARSADKLATIKTELSQQFNVQVEYIQLDLAKPGAAGEVKNWVDRNNFSVNILINNAGYGLWGNFESADSQDTNNMLQLNMITMVDLCREFIPALKKHPKAYILNVASTAAYQAVPTLAAYAASKAFVVLFTRGLRAELNKSSISVSCLSPGATATGFVDRAGMQKLKERADKFSMKAKVVASMAIRKMFKGKAEIIPGFTNWLSVQLTYLVPKRLPEIIAEGLYKTK